jgi:energy-coupling factor transport system substrate-specific component
MHNFKVDEQLYCELDAVHLHPKHKSDFPCNGCPRAGLSKLGSASFGPWVGLLAGFIGNTLGDALSGWGFYWNWSLGNGLMGMVAGLAMPMIKDFRARADIIKAVGWGILGIIVGMLFASLTEMFTGGIDLNTALVGYFTPAVLGNVIVTIVLLPILMIAFAAVAARRGR